jgi:hypothetical protein
MIENLPQYISAIFILTTIATLLLFYRAVKRSDSEKVRKRSAAVLVSLGLWLAIQALVTIKNIYNTGLEAIPPKIVVFGILPPVLTIILLFSTKSGRRFIDSLQLTTITYINVIRIPVEITLLWLFLNKAIPGLMTFEGRNFDIFSGITAPFIAWFGFVKGKLGRRFILAWNWICLALLANIVVNAILSAPLPFQKFAFDQPNIAILNFPFSWLPTFIVPVILFGHLVSFRQLRSK